MMRKAGVEKCGRKNQWSRDTLTMGRVKDEGTMILREYVDSQLWWGNTANLG